LPGGSAPSLARLRGIIVSVSATQMVMRERGGERVELVLSGNLVINEVFAINLFDIKAGNFAGAGGTPQSDGTQQAIAVHVFPESTRGAGEGNRSFEFMPQSTMTNATVADVVAAHDGRRLLVRYKDGEKTIFVPPRAAVVSFMASDRSLLVLGASLSVSAQATKGNPPRFLSVSSPKGSPCHTDRAQGFQVRTASWNYCVCG
jgi:hypothetical protein